ncbi:MAG: SbcC/MukB-like Walker B domain-containing protein [Lachnospirales bacterium]
MKPLCLEFKGFYNYKDGEKIDFTKLNEARLFGIFGKTASGKSAILDAISYALFGKIDRLGGKNPKDFINKECSSGYVKFTFSVSSFNGNDEEYTIERSYKKTGVKTGKIDFKVDCKFSDGLGNVLSTKSTEIAQNVESLLNIKENDYFKIVCLPQGKFSEFLKSKSSERTDFLRKIFDVGKYDVSSALKDELKKITTDLDYKRENIESRLLENVNPIEIDFEIDIKNYGLIRKYINEKIQRYDDNQEKYKSQLENIENEKAKVNKEYLKFNNAKDNFNELEKNKTNLVKCENVLLSFEEDIKKVELSKRVNKVIDSFLAFEKLCKNIKNVESEKSTLENSLKTLKDEFSKYENWEKEKKLIESDIYKEKIDLDKLIELDSSYINEQFNNKISDKELLLKSLDENLNEIEKVKVNVAKITNENNQNIELVNSKIEDAYNEKSLLENRNVLSRFLDKLVDNKPCPLCGSTSHPNVIELVIEEEVIENQNLIKKLENNIGSLKAEFVNKIRLEYDKIDLNCSEFYEKIIHNASSEVDNNLALVKQKITSEMEILQSLKASEKDFLNKLIAIGVKDFSSLNKKVKELDEKIKNDLELINNNDTIYFKLKDNIKETEVNLFNKISNLKKDLETKEDDFKNLMIKLEENDFTFDSFNGYKNKAMPNYEIVEIEKKIREVLEEQTGLNAKIKDLETKISNIGLSKEKVLEEIFEFEKKILEFDNIIKDNTVKITECNKFKRDLFEALEILDTLHEEYNKVELDLRKYQKLDKIVGSRRFVKHIISLKTKRLLDKTNDEIKKITMGKYELDIDDELNFSVKEYQMGTLKKDRRSINTLSGGETFIFSLCLSLALSSELAGSKGGRFDFYFIDEGFGTLDEDKIKDIYDMLKKLSEDMTIGLITHTYTMKNLVNTKILVGEDIDGNEITSGNRLTVIG